MRVNCQHWSTQHEEKTWGENLSRKLKVLPQHTYFQAFSSCTLWDMLQWEPASRGWAKPLPTEMRIWNKSLPSSRLFLCWGIWLLMWPEKNEKIWQLCWQVTFKRQPSPTVVIRQILAAKACHCPQPHNKHRCGKDKKQAERRIWVGSESSFCRNAWLENLVNQANCLPEA